MNIRTIARIGLLLLSGFGLTAGAGLSLEHLKTGEVCPMLGPMPACILVFLGYALVFIAGIGAPKSWASKAFYIGWTPVFLLALMGVILELTHGQTCPIGAADIPQCFFSLGMAALCWLCFRVVRGRV